MVKAGLRGGLSFLRWGDVAFRKILVFIFINARLKQGLSLTIIAVGCATQSKKTLLHKPPQSQWYYQRAGIGAGLMAPHLAQCFYPQIVLVCRAIMPWLKVLCF